MESHDDLRDLAELYVLGALPPGARQTFEAHLAVCASCRAEVEALTPVAAALAESAPPAEPSPDVRRALLARIHEDRPSKPSVSARGSWLPIAASLVLAAGLGAYALQLRARVSTLESELRDATLRASATEGQLAEARRAAFQAQSSVAVLGAPDLARIDLAGQPAAPRAAARAFWSRSRGLVFTASNLPAPPPGRTYQLWVLTKEPAPMSAGVMKPDANGRVTVMINTPADMPQPVAMAVTLEPEGGVPSPTGDKYLVGLAP